jgi:hypothetical protein
VLKHPRDLRKMKNAANSIFYWRKHFFFGIGAIFIWGVFQSLKIYYPICTLAGVDLPTHMSLREEGTTRPCRQGKLECFLNRKILQKHVELFVVL